MADRSNAQLINFSSLENDSPMILTLPMFVLQTEKKSRVKNIFIQKVNSSVCH